MIVHEAHQGSYPIDTGRSETAKRLWGGRGNYSDTLLAALDQELGEPEESLDDKLTVIPTWVQQQFADLAQLLREDSTRVREHFRRLSLDFTFSPVSDEGRPFLRVAVNSDIAPLPGLGQYFPSAASGDSHPRSGQ